MTAYAGDKTPSWSRSIANTVGTRINELRAEKGWSKEALGQKVGVRWNAVNDWETGKNPPSLESLLLLVDAFELGSIEEVLGGRLGTYALLSLRRSDPGDSSEV